MEELFISGFAWDTLLFVDEARFAIIILVTVLGASLLYVFLDKPWRQAGQKAEAILKRAALISGGRVSRWRYGASLSGMRYGRKISAQLGIKHIGQGARSTLIVSMEHKVRGSFLIRPIRENATGGEEQIAELFALEGLDIIANPIQTGDKEFDSIFEVRSIHADFVKQNLSNGRKLEAIKALFAMEASQVWFNGKIIAVLWDPVNMDDDKPEPSIVEKSLILISTVVEGLSPSPSRGLAGMISNLKNTDFSSLLIIGGVALTYAIIKLLFVIYK